MADVRALLKAKRQEARITHPLASYNTSGQLRCSACGTLVKHASAWEGHLGSKLHRTTVAQIREKEREKEEREAREREEKEARERALLGKRKAEEEAEEDVNMEELEHATKKQRVKETPKGFPADFFSDPSRAPVFEPDEEDQDQGTEENAQPPPPKTQLDLEWERFQKEVVNAPDFRETYENATVAAEPVMAEVMEGIPVTEAAAEQPEEVDEEELRRRKEQEERELIMDRILDEERAQEEADMKVTVMKNKLDALKKKRLAAKTAKSGS
ncbi:hypothetical protein VNI00_005201 [Paramarasmius palmivorus]|uniref:Coiled-coil domain-containing protein 16 n=1 Tax=Paramarasmius palmivorus TaxID=297713 RepID=A0AAW0DHT7_9AGAR